MLVKLPNCAIHRITAKGEQPKPIGVGLIAMGVGPGFIEGEFRSLALFETAPDQWELGDLNQFDCWKTDLMAECVSVPGVEGLVGFVMPAEVGGRAMSQHVVMRENDSYVPYQDIDAVRAKHGKVVLGHLWGEPDEGGFRTCSRCKERWRPGIE